MAKGEVSTLGGRPEQRGSIRRVGPIRCWVFDGEVQRFSSLADLSVDGARLLTAAPPAVGSVVSLRFRLKAEGEEVQATGYVIWRSAGFGGRGGVMGVHFARVSGVEEIMAYVEEA